MNKILVAVDGSEKSRGAVEKAVEFASCMKADITLITVVADINQVIDIAEASTHAAIHRGLKEREAQEKNLEKQGQQVLDEAGQILTEAELEYDTLLRKGDPADVICDVAEEENYDLIILADKGLGGVKRFFLGSISDKVVRYATTSVLVVK